MNDQSQVSSTIDPSMPHVFFVRHGQSEWNAAKEENSVYMCCFIVCSNFSRRDPMIFDSALTERGRAQALALAKQLYDLRPDLVVSSPLTRALTTAELALSMLRQDINLVPVTIVCPLATEILLDSCDVGRPTSRLRCEFPLWDWSLVPEHWWYGAPKGASDFAMMHFSESDFELKSRLNQLAKWLNDACGYYKRIVVFGHADTFFRFLGEPWMSNGEIRDGTESIQLYINKEKSSL